MSDLTIRPNDKFAILAIEGVYVELPLADVRLTDGTWVLREVPVALGAHWERWIGSLRAERIQGANLILLRTVVSQAPQIGGDAEQAVLTEHLIKLFSMLQLGGVPEYKGANLIAGAVQAEEAIVRQMSTLPIFYRSRGYSRFQMTVERLESAGRMLNGLLGLEGMLPKYGRFIRGLNVLMDGLRQKTGQERLHQCVRSLEALILPAVGETRRQFVHRCQTFAQATPEAAKALQEAFDMRSDAEHLHDWHRALSAYAENEREDVANHRTRQLEALALSAYSQILADSGRQAYFADEASMQDFWKLTDTRRRSIWDAPLDLSAVKRVVRYNQWGRAASS